ncbi:MAG: NAD(P)/FAD-dependent oxidoreductase [Frankiaceae bacterium]
MVIVGAGFAGVHAARSLARFTDGAADVVLINPTDYFLYLPLLPEVTAGVLDPRRVTVSLRTACPDAQLLPGSVDGVSLRDRHVEVVDPEGCRRNVGYDRLLVTAGSVNKLLPVPGVAHYAHGFRSIAEALYLRDHLLEQIELADAAEDGAERDARCTFVVVGAGYTGTEVAAHGQLLTRLVARRRPGLREQKIRWLLLDLAPRVLPELSSRLSVAAHRTLTRRGVEVCTGTSVKEATADGVRLSDGEFVPTRSLIWCVGVRPDPLVEQIGLPTAQGRLIVDAYLTVPGHPEVFACGDIAAVPDLTRPGELTGMTAQHAGRQGKLAAGNIAASLGIGEAQAYRHHDLGFVVDLAGAKATANPLGVPLSGLPAKAVTRGYHLLSLPGNRLRVASEWLLDAALPRQAVQFGLVSAAAVPLDTEHACRPIEVAASAPSHPSQLGRADELPSLRSARISTEAPQGARK